MNIWLIQSGEDIPLDNDIRKLRTAVLAEELASRGHQVMWWAASFSHQRKDWITRSESACTLPSGVRVEFLKSRGYRKNISFARLIDHRLVARDFKRRSGEFPVPDIIVCGLPPHDLAFQVARYANRHRVPLIVDARDFWPDMFLTVAPSFLRPMLRLLLQNEFRLTRYAFRQASAITAMSEDMLAWALTCCSRERTLRDRIFYLGYRPVQTSGSRIPTWLEPLQDRFIVAFIGTFSYFHSPAILVDVARQLQEAGRDDIAIVLAGAGGDFYERIVADAQNMPNITLPGWLQQDEISTLLDRASLGVCPTSTDARFFPNKTFLYFSKGLPVLSAFEGELRDVIESGKLGRFFHYQDADALTRDIIEFADNRDMYRDTCRRVREAFEQRYSEQVIYTAFADYVEDQAKSQPGAGPGPES